MPAGRRRGAVSPVLCRAEAGPWRSRARVAPGSLRKIFPRFYFARSGVWDTGPGPGCERANDRDLTAREGGYAERTLTVA